MSDFPGGSWRPEQTGSGGNPDSGSNSSATGGPAGAPPEGWYPDPRDAGGERYWDGTQWTHNTRTPQAVNPGAPALPAMGWYPDPADARLERYWDGAEWTRNTRVPPPVSAQAPSERAQAPQGQEPVQGHGRPREGAHRPAGVPHYGEPQQGEPRYGQSQPGQNQPGEPARGRPGQPGDGSWQAQPHADRHPAMPYRTEVGFAPANGPRTADGVRLAGWWARFAALLVDYVILTLFQTLLLMIFGRGIVAGMQAWQSDVMSAFESGSSDALASVPVSPADPRYGITTQWYIYSAALLVIQFLYATLFMHYKGATLGQMALGLRVVPKDRGRDKFVLPWGKSLLRNAGWLFCQVWTVIPGLSTLGVLLILVNCAWPLFNRRRQALHDLLASTQMISTRP
ncbi:RDD family protein [Propionibacterium sp.]|uniref:RDD family protein n=1 Tax=Propionibacterium sp. TaxID=1977903 RepID=UPI0039EADB8F